MINTGSPHPLHRIVLSALSCIFLGLASDRSYAESTPAGRVDVDSFWSHLNIGQNAGLFGNFTLDTSRGREWVIGAGFTPYWYSISYNDQKKSYEQTYAVPYQTKNYQVDSISKVTCAELSLDHDGKEIVVLQHGIFHILDGSTKEEIRQFSAIPSEAPHLFPQNVFVADINQDGQDELITNSLGLRIYDAGGTQIWSMQGIYESVEAVAQMDMDPSLEIITSTNVIDISSKSVQWQMPRIDHTSLDVADLNGDGNKEVLFLGYWQGVTAVDPITRNTLWTYRNELGMGAMLIANFDNSPEKELLLANGQNGELYVLSLNAATPVIKETVILPTRYTRSGHTRLLAMEDTDGDGTEELIWGTTDFSSNRNTFLTLYDPVGKVFEWESPPAMGAHGTPVTGDLTGDGIPELVVPTATDHILIFDATTLRLIASPEAKLDPYPATGIPTIRLQDVDGNGICELALFEKSRLGIFKYDAPSGSFNLLWQAKSIVQGRYYNSDWKLPVPNVENIIVADVDGDDDLDVLVTTGLGIDNKPDCIQIFDYNTGELEWISGDTLPQFPGVEAQFAGISSSVMADVDGNGHLDLLFIQANGTLTALDLTTKKIIVSRTGNFDCVAMMPDGQRFVAAQAGSRLSMGTVSSEGYIRWATWQGYADPEGWLYIKSVAPDNHGGFYAFAGNRIYYIDSKGKPRWISTPMSNISWKPAFLETSTGTEVYAGWEDGISGFYTGYLNALPTITVTPTGSAIENGPGDGKFIFSASDAGVEASKVQFSLSGTAILGTDYTIQGATRISPTVWQVSVDAASSSAVTIVPLDDATIEGTESIVLTPLSGDSYQLASPNSVPAALVDNEQAIKIKNYNLAGYEGGSGDVKPAYLSFTVVRSGDLSKPLTVALQLSGTATIKKDYTTSFTKSLVIPAGAREIAVNFVVLSDTSAEPTETVTLTALKSAAYAIEQGYSTATATIYDGQPTLGLGAAVTTPQGVSIPISISSPSRTATKVALTGTVTPVGGKAKKIKATVTIPANATQGSYLIAAGTTATTATISLGSSTSYHLTAPQSITVAVPKK